MGSLRRAVLVAVLASASCHRSPAPPRHLEDRQEVQGPVRITRPAAVERRDDGPGAPLRIVALEPDHGRPSGGDRVILRGRGFDVRWKVSVRFAGKLAPEAHIDSPTTITVVTPPGREGAAPVGVVFESGQKFLLPNRFQFLSATP